MGASRRSTGTLNRGDEAPRDSSDSGYDGEVDIGGGTGVRRPNAQANGANGSRLSPGQRAG